MEKVYLLNSGNVPIDWEHYPKVIVEEAVISTDSAKMILQNTKFVNAIGHEATAKFLSKLLDVDIKPVRRKVLLEPGDRAICFQLLDRLPEGKVLTEEEISKVQYKFILAYVKEKTLIEEIEESER